MSPPKQPTTYARSRTKPKSARHHRRSGIREEIDDAIATELGHPESLSKAVELKDIGWAQAGIAVDAVGIVVQLCA
jgi:hypothetical protein